MSGTTSNIAITITAADLSGQAIDKLGKTVAKLQEPADKAGRSLGKLADGEGLTRAAERMKSFGDNALGAARAVERVASPMAMITSAATVAGMIELTRRWGEFGNQANKLGYSLRMPVDRLSAFEGGARLAGSSAAAMDASLAGLQDKLSGAAFARDKDAVALFTQLGVKFGDIEHGARTSADAIGDVAESIKDMDPLAQKRVLEQLNISPDLLPMMKNGRGAFLKFATDAERTGGVFTQKMSENAKEMNRAWQDFGLTVEGVGNRIVDSWSGTVTKVLDSTSRLIQGNKALADSYTQTVGGSLLALSAIKPAAWLLRFLGLGAVAEIAGPFAAPLIGLGAAAAVSGQNNLPMYDEYGRVVGTWAGGGAPADNPMSVGQSSRGPGHFSGEGDYMPQPERPEQPAAPSGPIARPNPPGFADPVFGPQTRLPRGIRNNNPGNLNFAGQAGATLEGPGGRFARFGTMAEGIAALGAQLERYGDRGLNTIASVVNAYAPASENDTAAYVRQMTASTGFGATQPLNMHDPATLQALERGIITMENGPGYAGLVPSSGAVHVTVDLRGAPPGTTASATATGAATTAPPRIETSMAHAS